MINCYPKSARIRTRRQFQRISQQCTKHVGQWIIVEARENKYNLTRLGITASKHFGNSVQRNRFKRIVREAFRLCRHQLPQGFDLNVKPRNGDYKAKSTEILAELLSFVNKPT